MQVVPDDSTVRAGWSALQLATSLSRALGKCLPRAHKRGNDYSSQLIGNRRRIAAPCPITMLQERPSILHQVSQNLRSCIGPFCRISVLLCSGEQAELIWDCPWAVHTGTPSSILCPDASTAFDPGSPGYSCTIITAFTWISLALHTAQELASSNKSLSLDPLDSAFIHLALITALEWFAIPNAVIRIYLTITSHHPDSLPCRSWKKNSHSSQTESQKTKMHHVQNKYESTSGMIGHWPFMYSHQHNILSVTQTSWIRWY